MYTRISALSKLAITLTNVVRKENKWEHWNYW